MGRESLLGIDLRLGICDTLSLFQSPHCLTACHSAPPFVLQLHKSPGSLFSHPYNRRTLFVSVVVSPTGCSLLTRRGHVNSGVDQGWHMRYNPRGGWSREPCETTHTSLSQLLGNNLSLSGKVTGCRHLNSPNITRPLLLPTPHVPPSITST